MWQEKLKTFYESFKNYSNGFFGFDVLIKTTCNLAEAFLHVFESDEVARKQPEVNLLIPIGVCYIDY